MTDTTNLPTELRDACMKIRVKASTPLSALIPLMQKAADAIDQLTREKDALQAKVQDYALQLLVDDAQAMGLYDNPPGSQLLHDRQGLQVNFDNAHVIMMNDSVEHVVIERDGARANLNVAIEKMHQLAVAYFSRNRWSFSDGLYSHITVPFSPAWCTYLARCRWHVRTVQTS